MVLRQKHFKNVFHQKWSIPLQHCFFFVPQTFSTFVHSDAYWVANTRKVRLCLIKTQIQIRISGHSLSGNYFLPRLNCLDIFGKISQKSRKSPLKKRWSCKQLVQWMLTTELDISDWKMSQISFKEVVSYITNILITFL